MISDVQSDAYHDMVEMWHLKKNWLFKWSQAIENGFAQKLRATLKPEIN